MDRRVCAAFLCLLLATVVASCGPGSETSQSPTPGPSPSPVDAPGPSSALADCQGRLAFVGRVAGEKDIFIVNADGSGLVNITNGQGTETSPSWSPAGVHIVFARHVGNSDIYTIRSDGSGLLPLTDQPSREYAPAWSPDGGRVLFASTAGYATELFVVDAGGGEAVPLTGSMAHKPDFAWSPDGSRVAFTMLDGYNQGDVYVVAAPDEMGSPSSGVLNLTQHPANDCCVAWAPDGERLLFLSSRNGAAQGRSLGITGTGSSHRNVLVHAGQGRLLTASSGPVVPLTTVIPEPPKDIYLIQRDGTGLIRLTDSRGAKKQASWSPEGAPGGERIAFVWDRDGNDEIYVMTAPGGAGAGDNGLTRLTDDPEDDLYPTWSPDGSCLAFISYRGGEWGLYVANADGSGLSKVADNADGSSSPSWSP